MHGVQCKASSILRISCECEGDSCLPRLEPGRFGIPYQQDRARALGTTLASSASRAAAAAACATAPAISRDYLLTR